MTATQKQGVLRLLEAKLDANKVAKTVGLSPSTVYKIRREHEKQGELADPELGPHGRELFYFGQWLRDCLRVPKPDYTGDLTGRNLAITWERQGGWGGVLTGRPPSDQEQAVEAVERHWGADAREYPLFNSFRQHLSRCQCWDILDQTERAASGLQKASKRACQAILNAVRNSLPGLAEQDALAMATSLFWDSFRRNQGLVGLAFSYEPEKPNVSGVEGWQLAFGALRTGIVDDPAKLEPLAIAHKHLRETEPYGAEVKSLVSAYEKANESAQKFKNSLSPDALLRKLILKGHCDLCL